MKHVTTDEVKVCDYSRYGDINDYIGSLKWSEYKIYRKNWLRASRCEREFDFPLFLVFETMFQCNLKCVMCIHSAQEKIKYGYKEKLPLEKYKEIMEECSKHYCPSLTIGGTSEPLLDINLADMIGYANESGFLDTMVNTNATLLTEEIGKELIKKGLTRIRIGFDGATANTYEKIRVGADFEKVKQNIMNFIRLRNELKSKFPVVRLSCVHLSENESEIKEFIEFWKPVVDYVSIQRYKPHEFTKERITMGRQSESCPEKIRCSQPFERLYIRGSGTVHACCSMVYGPIVGNVFENSIYDIWNGKLMNELRNALQKGKWSKIPKCRECLVHSYSASI